MRNLRKDYIRLIEFFTITMTLKVEPLKAIKMIQEQEKSKVKKEFATERIHLRCTPKQKKIYMNYGGSALITKMLDKMGEHIEEKKSKHHKQKNISKH